LKGRKVHPDLSLAIAPGSRQVFEMIARDGVLADMIAAGARIMESACGFCIGAGQAPKTGGVSLRTNNRNFEGRSGTASAQVYLVSPETAALSALVGELVDPLDMRPEDFPALVQPDSFIIDDSMIIPPSDVEKPIFRGPNIGEPPYTEPLSDSLRGIVQLKVGDKITTDHIMPAGARLIYRSNIPKYSEYVFEGVDPSFSSRAMEAKAQGLYTAVLGGHSYGQGSSREHAAICPMYLGVRIVMARSFERIHAANLVNFGILPLVLSNGADYDEIRQGQEFEAADLRSRVAGGEGIRVRIGGRDYDFELPVTPRQRKILLEGGLLNYTRSRMR